MDTLTVGTLRVGSNDDGLARRTAIAALDRLARDEPSSTGGGILVVRRLRIATDGRAGGDLAAARRSAVRSVAGRVPLGASAVLFADEADLLACLTRDHVEGRRDAWYWRHLHGAARRTPTLAEAWSARARWVPAALHQLPLPVAVRAVAALTATEARTVRRHVTVEFAVPRPAPTDATDADVAGVPDAPWRRWLPAPDGSGAVVPAAPRTGAAPTAGSGPAAGTTTPAAATSMASTALGADQEALLGTALALADSPSLVRRPAFGTAAARWLAATSSGAPVTARLPAVGIAGVAAGPGPAVATPVPAHAQRSGPGESPVPRAARRDDPVGEITSRLATAFYLVNALTWLPAAVTEEAGGWSLVEACARELLLTRAANRDRRADALWDVLARLAGRDADAAAPRPVRSRTAGCAMRRELRRRRIGLDVLATPGRIVVTRTHVDVLLDLESIDMAARIAGLDRDPGWVPDLGRVVTFHFGTSRVLP